MQNNWQHFLFSVVVQLFLPLMPLVIELWLTGTIKGQTYAISVAMYSISIGVATRNLALLGLSIFVAVLFSSLFGYLASGNQLHYSVSIPSIVTILSFMFIHATERYKRHVKEGELFIDFGGNNV